MLNLLPDCLIAKVDGPGQVDLLEILRKVWLPHLYILLDIFTYSFFM